VSGDQYLHRSADILVSLRSRLFVTFDNFRDILLNISILAIVALAQAMVIITRSIDLSVSSVIGLVAMWWLHRQSLPGRTLPLLVCWAWRWAASPVASTD
jgi:ribose/xylose/arabinose/galactoside ABC-type transport system permease subunit